jgi:hypothetical protein
MTKTYTNKSNATRSAKGYAATGQAFTVTGNKEAGFMVAVECHSVAQVEAAKAKGHAVVDYSQTVDIADMDENGAGTEANPSCPHCGVNHMQNGYGYHDPAEGFHCEERVHCCLACNGEWGAEVPAGDFAAAYAEAGGHQPRQMCQALRTVARNWTGTRNDYVKKAAAMGINETTAGRSWQMAGRNRSNENK